MSTNFITLLTKFKNVDLDENYTLQNEIKAYIFTYLEKCIKDLDDTMNLDFNFFQILHYDNLYAFSFCNIKEVLPEIFDNEIIAELKNDLKQNNSYLFNFVDDLEIVSDYENFEEYEGYGPLEKYIMTVGEFMLENFETIQDEYIKDLKKNIVRTIENGYLNALYSPYTDLGIKRFDKERKELFDE